MSDYTVQRQHDLDASQQRREEDDKRRRKEMDKMEREMTHDLTATEERKERERVEKQQKDLITAKEESAMACGGVMGAVFTLALCALLHFVVLKEDPVVLVKEDAPANKTYKNPSKTISGILTAVDIEKRDRHYDDVTFTFKNGDIIRLCRNSGKEGAKPLLYKLNERNTVRYNDSDFWSIEIDSPEDIPIQDLINKQIIDRLIAIEDVLPPTKELLGPAQLVK